MGEGRRCSAELEKLIDMLERAAIIDAVILPRVAMKKKRLWSN